MTRERSRASAAEENRLMNKRIYRSTLLGLVLAVQDYSASDEEAVAIIAHLLNTGRVVLTGTFAGQRIAEAIAA
jgi:hypothetical protein